MDRLDAPGRGLGTGAAGGTAVGAGPTGVTEWGGMTPTGIAPG